jgi:hypothetical protein
MAVSISHFGEALITRMANDLRGKFLDLCQLRGEADPEFISGTEPLAHQELQLLPYAGIAFDGASRVDLVVRLAMDRAAPFEVKLGTTRLTRSRIDEEWLCGCGFSHGRTRFRGNMMSILDRRFPPGVPLDDLRVKLGKDQSLKLTPTWFVIVKDCVLKTWNGENRPAFSDRVKLVSMESIVECYGGKSRFNSLVREVLAIDYYEEWIARNPD